MLRIRAGSWHWDRSEVKPAVGGRVSGATRPGCAGAPSFLEAAGFLPVPSIKEMNV